jgi:hypothetical protein
MYKTNELLAKVVLANEGHCYGMNMSERIAIDTDTEAIYCAMRFGSELCPLQRFLGVDKRNERMFALHFR